MRWTLRSMSNGAMDVEFDVDGGLRNCPVNVVCEQWPTARISKLEDPARRTRMWGTVVTPPST